VIWGEILRRAHLVTHGVNFRDGGKVLESQFRSDVPVIRNGQEWIFAIAYILETFGGAHHHGQRR
jgi:hypothetical protein